MLNKSIFYRNFVYHISNGPILECEIRIAGIDNRINELKNDLIEYFLKSEEYETYYNYAIEFLGTECLGIYKKIYRFENLSFEEKKLFKDIEKKMDLVQKKYRYEVFENFFIDKSDIDFNSYDIILFLPNGCFKYLHQYVFKENVDKIMFWEYHVDKTKNSMYKLYNKEFKGKKVLIIDSIYSGKTLINIKKKVEDEGGIVDLLGISPKSSKTINLLDYVLILDKIYKVSDLEFMNDNFFEEKYKEFVRRNSSDKRRNTSKNKN